MSDKERALYRKYPRIFPEGFMIEHGDGWIDLVDEMCTKLQAVTDAGNFQVEAAQFKEKFGVARLYIDIIGKYTEEQSRIVYNIIGLAEEKSRGICEMCGKPGKLRPGNWVKTLCDECTKGGKSLDYEAY